MKSHHKRTKGSLAGLRRIGYFAAFSALIKLALPVAAQQTDSAAILIHDAAGAMSGQLDGDLTKVESAPVDESDDEASAMTFAGPWQLIGVPPYQVQAEASPLLTLVLAQPQPNGAIGGSWTAGALLAGPQVAGREGTFTTATHENDALRMTFTVGEPIAAPMTLYLTPYGIGHAGSLSSGSMGIRVVMWPDGHVPPTLAEMRLAVHGPEPSDFVDMTGSRASAPQDPVEAARQSSRTTEAILLTFRPVEQFGTGCSMNAEIANPSGEAFTLFAPINATANGQAVRPALRAGEPVVLEIDVYTETGATLTPPMLMSPCNTLVVSIGPVQCRMGVGDSGSLTDCPLPVEVTAIPEFADLVLISSNAGASFSRPTSSPATVADADAIIPVNLAGRDPESALRARFSNR